MNLKQKTSSGIIWNFIDNFSRLGITFIVGIILARLLEPHEFGLIGMTTIYIAISQSIISTGFKQALIRKQHCTQADYSTVFFINLGGGILFYFILFFSAGAISSFFNEPQLKQIVQVLSLGIIISSLTMIQIVKLEKEINFKIQSKISIITTIVSGIIGIWMAYYGYGVWSLVIKILSGYALSALLLWVLNKWKPALTFSKDSFKELFSFGSRMLLSGLIDTVYRNVYVLIIGKYFSVTQLGYYTRAEQFANLPSQNLTGVIKRVIYPVLSSLQDNIPLLKAAFKKLIKSTMLITFILMIGLAVIAKPLVLTLIGIKWLPSVIYLQMLCFVAIFYPLHSFNLTLLMVLGRSDLFLKLAILHKLLVIPVIIIGIYFGIKALIGGMILISFIGYYFNSFWTGKLINYPIIEQIKDIFPAFIFALFIGVILFSVGSFINISNLWKLSLQLIIGSILFFGIAEKTKMVDYLYLKGIIIDKFFKKDQK